MAAGRQDRAQRDVGRAATTTLAVVCGRLTATISRYDLASVFSVDEVEAPELPARWNVAPSQDLYMVTADPSGARKLVSARWGLVPSWAPGPGGGSRLINARAETLAQRPAYREALMARRALLPVTGFFEWRRPGPGAPGAKIPFYFRPKGDGPLVIAGLWETWRGPEGIALRTCTIVTTAANEAVARAHHRMPVILPVDVWDEWLCPRPLPPARLHRLLVPAPCDGLELWPVSSAVNSARHDGPGLTARAPEPLGQLALI
jgi:putative SOS response-associated peptidase YedK